VDGAADATADPDAATRVDEDDDFCRGVVASIDDHLDRIDHDLDAIAVARRDGANASASAAASPASRPTPDAAPPRATAAKRGKVPFHVGTLARPQDSFEIPVDNSDVPFHPPVPWNHPNPELYESVPGVHPLSDVLDRLEYPPSALAAGPLRAPAPVSDSPLVFVDSESALESLAADLDAASEFAVDLEHHNYRSFQGFTCLMQVSTRSRDYVVDAISLRHLLRDALAGHFADPKKLKVFHGADMDVQWLQRDFGIYVVGMFDTGQAARVLDLPSKGLAYLLSHYCGASADKRFQLADWRLRPLPSEMLEYARGDTHHLLYVHDRLKQQLEASSGASSNPPGRDLIRETLDRSRDVCRKLYKATTTTPLSYREDYERNAPEAKNLTAPQLAAYAAVFAWRDKKARELDESLGYVAPRALLLDISRACPTTSRALLATARGNAPLVAKHAAEIVDIVQRAVAVGAPPAMPPTAGREEAAEANANASEAAAEDAGMKDPKEKTMSSAPASVTAGGGSAMASMMGAGKVVSAAAASVVPSNAATRPAAAMVGGGGGAMARMLSGGSTTSHFGDDDDVAAAAAAANRVLAALAANPVPLNKIFPAFDDAAARAEAEAEAVKARRATEEEAKAKASAAGSRRFEDQPEGPLVELPGGYTAPAPMRKNAGEKHRAAREAAEREAVVKARAEEARNALAERRRSAMRGMDSDSDSDDEGRTLSEDEDERALASVGAGGFDFAAAAAAVLPGGASFAALGAGKKAGGRGDGRGGGRGAGASTAAKTKRKKGKEGYDKDGRMILVEPFKPGKKSKAFPRSGDRSTTFR
jgi:exosome complex exonuclease RRP6